MPKGPRYHVVEGLRLGVGEVLRRADFAASIRTSTTLGRPITTEDIEEITCTKEGYDALLALVRGYGPFWIGGDERRIDVTGHDSNGVLRISGSGPRALFCDRYTGRLVLRTDVRPDFGFRAVVFVVEGEKTPVPLRA